MRPLSWALRAGVVFACALIAGAGCNRNNSNPQNPQEETGSIRMHLTSADAGDDVVSVRVDVFRAGAPFASQTVRLETGDAFFTLPPGNYDVTATPLAADGAPSRVCSSASTSAVVAAGRTTEITLPMFCSNGGTGGLDVIVTLEHQPSIRQLVIDPSKFVSTCQPATFTVTAFHPDGKLLTYLWSLATAPSGSRASLNGIGNRAVFTAQTPGDYDIGIQVQDPAGHRAGLIFPMHVGGAAVPDGCPQLPPPILAGTTLTGTLKPAAQPRIIRQRNVVANTAPLYSRQNQLLTMNLFPDTTLELVGIRLEAAGPGFVWVGQVKGQPQSAAFLSVRGDLIAGNIATEKGEVFQIRPAGNGVHLVTQVDPSSWHIEGDPIALFPAPGDASPCGGTDEGHDIDALIVYTAAARAAAGGVDQIEVLIYLATAETNQGYLNSGITQHLRLVRLAETAYVELGVSVDRDRLKNPSDGFMDDVHTMRNDAGADVVVLVEHYPADPYCGMAYIMGTVSTAFEDSAFAVVEDSCATGYYSFGHELGHVMSARHDRYVDPTDGSPYSYNHGFTDATDGWRTVMAYNNACVAAGTSCTRILYWSNPGNTYGGVAMGVSSGLANAADNHLTLNNTAATVANFRCSSPGVSNVWMRDTWDDTGLEPDPHTAGEDMWKSPYIWVRTAQDTTLVHQHEHQNPTFGAPAWVYAKLHNGGTAAANGTLEIYWANASAGLSWPADWHLIGSQAVSAFTAHSTTVVEISWPSLPGDGHFCLLARWVSPADPMTFPEGSNIDANVRNNNNLVWRNIHILAPGPDGTMDADFIVRNPGEAPLALFIGPVREEVNGSFFLYSRAVISLDETLRGAWAQGGSKGSGFRMLNDGTLLVTDPAGAILDNIFLGARLDGRAHLHFDVQADAPARNFNIEAVEFSKLPGSTTGRVGGVMYEIHP